jgi:hypothetical protein
MNQAIAETVHVEDMDHFIRLLFAWHEDKVKTLEHMLTIPEGTEVIFNEGEPVTLSGDVHKGFVIGLTLGLMELGHLPFAAEAEDSSDDPADKPSANDQPTAPGANDSVH